MHIYFDPLDQACKTVTGAAEQGQEIQFNLYLLQNEATNTEEAISPSFDASFLLALDGNEEVSYPMERKDFGWSIRLTFEETGLYFYAFRAENGYVCEKKGTYGQFTFEKGNFFHLTVYEKGYRTPEWFKGGVMYQIFPDRFYRSGTMPDIKGRIKRKWGEMPYFLPNENGKVLNNDFFGGNINGIREKLPYLKSLGVSVIYLNPIFQATSNHRYDTANYLKIDPMFGTEKEFESFVKEAEQANIRIVLDGVFNHTGDNSVYFNKYGEFDVVGAYQSKDSPYYEWYTFQEYPNRYSSWWGIDVLPELNERSESYQNFVFGKDGVLEKWLDFGIGGYRLDVADELPDFFLEKLRTTVKRKNADAIVIGEVWEDASDKIAYSERRKYLQGKELDSVMNYPLKDAIVLYLISGKTDVLSETMRMLVDHYPKQTLDCLMNILGTHDTSRILTVLGGQKIYDKREMAKEENRLTAEEKTNAVDALKAAALLQYMLPGVPCVYYGDEIGTEGYGDPFCRQCFDWDRIDEALHAYYATLGTIRKKYRTIFKDGVYEELFSRDGCFVFKRTKKTEQAYVFVNRSEIDYRLSAYGRFKNAFTSSCDKNGFDIPSKSFGLYLSGNNINF